MLATWCERARARNLRRGYFWTLGIAAAAIWAVCLLVLTLVTKPDHASLSNNSPPGWRNSRPAIWMRGCSREVDDEIWQCDGGVQRYGGAAARGAGTAGPCHSVASWQTLARKMAHEVKNSLTPIRLTMEEILARRGERDDRFLEQASQIVVDEVVTLEKRVRAFSQFASEPPVQLAPVDVNALVDERICFLRTAHPEITYKTQLDSNAPRSQTRISLKAC